MKYAAILVALVALYATLAVAANLKSAELKVKVNNVNGDLSAEFSPAQHANDTTLDGFYSMHFYSLVELHEGNVVKVVNISKNAKVGKVKSENHTQSVEVTAEFENDATFSLLSVLYNVNDSSKVEMFNETITPREQSMEYFFEVRDWPFLNKNNTLRITTEIRALSKNQSNLNDSVIRKNSKNGVQAISFFGGSSTDKKLFVTFPEEIRIDGGASSDFFIEASLLSEMTGKGELGSLELNFDLPHFFSSAVIDPNIGLGESGKTSSSTTSSSHKNGDLFLIIVASVGGVIAAVVIAAILITIVRRQRQSSYEEI